MIEAQDAVLLGRRTEHAATSTPPSTSWANTTVIEGPVPDFVRDLKNQPGGDIGVHGSIELARSLFAAGLVDELRLVIAPAVAGAGRRLFEGEGALQELELVRSEGTPSGAVLVDYRVRRRD